MKKSIKPLIMLSISVFVLFAFFTLIYVGTKLECERMTKEKVIAQQKLTDVKNWRIDLIAKSQALSSEERIVAIAKDELGMLDDSLPPVVMTVSKERIKNISSAIDKKYEQ
jgi:cell division protein FtsL